MKNTVKNECSQEMCLQRRIGQCKFISKWLIYTNLLLPSILWSIS
jgi:hypothetical protein